MTISEIIEKIDALYEAAHGPIPEHLTGQPRIEAELIQTYELQLVFEKVVAKAWPALRSEITRLQETADCWHLNWLNDERVLGERIALCNRQEAALKDIKSALSYLPYESTQRLRERVREALAVLDTLKEAEQP
jgi:hypothetical protein